MRSTKILSSKFILILLTLVSGINCFSASETVGVINNINGNVFILKNGKFTTASKGIHLSSNDEIIVELGSFAQFLDYKDRLINLSGSTTIKLARDTYTLKKGMLWVQLKKKVETVLMTGNSRVSFEEGEGVLSYDPSSSMSQYVSVDGLAQMSNLAQKEFEVFISPGSFSLINPTEDSGRPRPQSEIGEKSYKKIRNLFSFVRSKRRPIEKISFPMRKIKIKREIASVKKEITKNNMEIESQVRQKKALEENLREYRKKKIVYKYPKVKVNLFARAPEQKKAQRKPASEAKPKPSRFRQDLFKQYNSQKKYDESMRQLVNELESFKMDYFESY